MAQEYTVDWSQLMVDQYDCGLPISSGASSSYSDVDIDLMVYDGIKVSITHGPDENLFCASGKIRFQNGKNNYVYSATLDGETKTDCSWMSIQFSEPVYDVSFDLIDVDQANLINWQDNIKITPKWSDITANNNLTIDENTATISGNINCESGDDACNTRLSFSQPVIEIRLDYCYGDRLDDNAPDRQIYNIGNVNFRRANIQPEIIVQASCPGDYSMITLKEMLIQEDEQLQLIIANSNSIVQEIFIEEGAQLLHQRVQKSFNECGTFPILVRIVKSKNQEIIGMHINDLIPETEQYWFDSIQINDTDAPYFTDKLSPEVTLFCNEDIPSPFLRVTEDICTASHHIDQSVNDYETLWNEECYEYSVSRVWTITDACGNQAQDSVIYTFIPEEMVIDTTVIDKVMGDHKVIACNAFSPNGDGVNDYFTFSMGSQYRSAELYIYDRYGSLYHKQHLARDHINTSDFGGNLKLSIGVYVWVTHLTQIDGTKSWNSGEVTLIK